jgi:hypothetical protein
MDGAGLLHGLLRALGWVCVSAAALLELKALLGRQPAGLDGPPLHLTRAGFLLLSGALAAGTPGIWDARGGPWALRPGQLGDLLSCLVFFAVLHVHRVKAFRGRPEAIAGVAGWALATGAWLAAR